MLMNENVVDRLRWVWFTVSNVRTERVAVMGRCLLALVVIGFGIWVGSVAIATVKAATAAHAQAMAEALGE